MAQAADAYAFGILMWELYSCARAWANLTHVQVAFLHRPHLKPCILHMLAAWLHGHMTGLLMLGRRCDRVGNSGESEHKQGCGQVAHEHALHV